MDSEQAEIVVEGSPTSENKAEPGRHRQANDHDVYFRGVMAIPEVSTELLESYLPESILTAIDMETLQVEPTHFVDEKLQLSVSDMVFRVQMHGEDAFIAVIAEHQSTADKHMVIRTQRYKLKAMEYYAMQAKDVGTLLNDKPYPAVYCLVFYHGERPYPYPIHLAEQINAPQALAQLVSEPTFQLMDLHEISDEQLREQTWAGIMGLVFKHARRDNFADYYLEVVQLIKALVSKNSVHLLRLTLEYVERKAYIDKSTFMQVLNKEFTEDMRGEAMTVVEQFRQEGCEETREAIAINMLKDGMSHHKIAKMTGLTVSAIMQLKQQQGL